jgi:hypothetical protein
MEMLEHWSLLRGVWGFRLGHKLIDREPVLLDPRVSLVGGFKFPQRLHISHFLE